MQSQELKELYIIRDGAETDKPFIFSTFLRGLYYGEPYFTQTPKHAFMSVYHKTLEYILNLPQVKVRVACLKDDPDVILGFAIIGGNGEVAHWVFVKSAWRSIGIAKALVPSTVRIATHKTTVGDALLRKHKNVVFNPFELR